jgi:hypothetical protein
LFVARLPGTAPTQAKGRLNIPVLIQRRLNTAMCAFIPRQPTLNGIERLSLVISRHEMIVGLLRVQFLPHGGLASLQGMLSRTTFWTAPLSTIGVNSFDFPGSDLVVSPEISSLYSARQDNVHSMQTVPAHAPRHHDHAAAYAVEESRL